MSSILDVRIPIEDTPDGYRRFMECKGLPHYEVRGSDIWTDEMSHSFVFGTVSGQSLESNAPYLFDYQRFVTNQALRKRRFAAMLDCGLGKTAIEVAWAHEVSQHVGRVLFLCPLAVLEDVQRFVQRFYGYRFSNLRNQQWRTDIAILNWESMRDHDSIGKFSGIVLDESSILKNSTGATRQWLTGLAKSAPYRLACSATPSPNEHAEYATHAVWLGMASTLAEFYGQWFRKDGTRWRLKGHAVDPFYRSLASWCCYIQKPSEVGFFDCQAEMADDPYYDILATSAPDHRVTDELFVSSLSLGESRKVFGALRYDTTQPRFRDACASIGDDRTLVWVSRNAEESVFHQALGGHLITGTTPVEERVEKLDDFRDGRVRVLVSKPSIMGFGVNIPEAQTQLFSGYTWSFEQFYQAVRRSHRFGRQGRLRVVLPVTEQEQPIWDALRRKMRTFDTDVRELQSRLTRGVS